MASENETVADIANEMRSEWAQVYFSEGSRRKDGEYCDNEFAAIEPETVADRIEAAHQRDVAKLEHWIKSAARWIKCHDIYHTSGDDLIKQAKEILNDDGEFLFKKGSNDKYNTIRTIPDAIVQRDSTSGV